MHDSEREMLLRECLDLTGFLVVSARGLLDEPSTYGPLRLVDAASRFVELLDSHGLACEALSQLQEMIERGKESCMGQPEDYIAFLDSLVLHVVTAIQDD